MAPLRCVCGDVIPFGSEEVGPVCSIGSLKFYERASMWGHPSSRQKVLLCDRHTVQLIEFLKEVQRDGRDPQEVPE